MKIQLLPIFVFLCLVSCSGIENDGFRGEWEGSSITIVDGNPVSSATTAVIADIEDMIVECNVIAGGVSYIFDTEEIGGKLIFSNAPAKNLTDPSTQTLLTGNAELIEEDLLMFNHQVVTMEGSAIVSSVDYNLEFTRK